MTTTWPPYMQYYIQLPGPSSKRSVGMAPTGVKPESHKPYYTITHPTAGY